MFYRKEKKNEEKGCRYNFDSVDCWSWFENQICFFSLFVDIYYLFIFSSTSLWDRQGYMYMINDAFLFPFPPKIQKWSFFFRNIFLACKFNYFAHDTKKHGMLECLNWKTATRLYKNCVTHFLNPSDNKGMRNAQLPNKTYFLRFLNTGRNTFESNQNCEFPKFYRYFFI